MKRLNSIILILFLTVQVFGQGIAHYQISEPTAERNDSVIFYKKVGDFWYMTKGVIDTSHVQGLDKYLDDRGDFAWQMVIDTLGFYALKDSVFWVKDTNGINYQAGNIGVGVASNANAKIATDGAVLFGGAYSSTPADPPATGAGTRMMWYADKAAFRAGRVTGTQWDKANIGIYSTAIGFSPTASGTASTAIGFSPKASGNTSTAMGYGTEASGDYSTAMGVNTTAPSGYETVFGRYNTIYTPISTTGWNSSDRLFTIGNGTSSVPSNAMTVLKSGYTGFGTDEPTEVVDIDGNVKADTVKAWLSTVFADSTEWADFLGVGSGGTSQWTDDANGITYADNVGVGVASNALAKVATNGSVLFGGTYSSTPADPPVSGEGARMMWYPSKVAFRAGYVDGTQWDVGNTGNFSTAFGYVTTASGDYSTAWGAGTIASGIGSSAFGAATTASGLASTAFGGSTVAPSVAETVFGVGNTLYTPYGGAYDWDSRDRLFTIGNGSVYPSNAMTVLKSGFTGFGTDLPEARLHVNGDIIGDTLRAVVKPDPDYIDSTAWKQFLGVGAGSGGGTVTSVGLTSTDLTIEGATSPITTSGTFTANIKNAGVQYNHLSANVISGQTAILSAAMNSTNKLLLHNGTALRSVDLANLKSWLDLDKYSYWQLLTNSGATTNSLLINSGKSVTLKAGTNMTLDYAEASGSATVTFNATGGSSTSQWTTDDNGITYSGNVGIGKASTSAIKLDISGSISSVSSSSSIPGIYSYNPNYFAVAGISYSSHGVWGESTNGLGGYFISANANALYAGTNSSTSYAGHFFGGKGVNSNNGYYLNNTRIVDASGYIYSTKYFTQHGTTPGSYVSIIDKSGYIPPQLADEDAFNNRIYFSPSRNKLVFKDPDGIVHELY